MASFFGEVVTGSYRFIDDEDEDLVESFKNNDFVLTEQVSKEDGVLVFAEGEVASAFGRMLLGDGKAELLGEIVTKEEERVVAEVVRGAPGATLVLVRRNVEQADSLALARLAFTLAGDCCTTLAITSRPASQCIGSSSLSSHCLTSSAFKAKPPCSLLPLPTLISGPSSALLTLAHMRGKPALMVVSWQELDTVDSLAMEGFRCLSSLDCLKKAKMLPPKDFAQALAKIRLPARDSLYL